MCNRIEDSSMSGQIKRTASSELSADYLTDCRFDAKKSQRIQNFFTILNVACIVLPAMLQLF